MKSSLPFVRKVAFSVVASTVLLASLTGCSANFDPLAGTTPPQSAIGAMQGIVHGGQGPIVGASVYVYQVNTTAYGGASLALADPVLTDANGKFSITSYTTTCTAGLPVYLYSVGGNAGGNGSNISAGLLAALGPCPSSGTLAQAYPSVNMNEVSTVAMAYALSGFATDATHIGYSGSALGLQGITNAFATAENIFNITSGVPTSTAATNTTATNGSSVGTLPTLLINTVADILASCVNSNGNGQSPCNSLLFYATSTGQNGGLAAHDTATAAIYIAKHPTANVAHLFALDGGIGAPFQNALTTQPSDFSLTIGYTTTNFDEAGFGRHELAIDAAGNVWAAVGDQFLFKFTPVGIGSSTPTPTLTQPQSVAIDNAAATGGTATVYVAGSLNSTVGRFNSSSGAYINGYLTANTNTGLTPDLTIDNAGNIWAANFSESTVGRQTPAGTGNATIFTYASMQRPSSIAADTNGNVLLTNIGDGNIIKFNSAGTGSVLNSGGGGEGGQSIAISSGNTVWAANYESVISTSSTGVTGVIDGYTNTGDSENGIAIDGAGNVWTAAQDASGGNGEILEVDSSGAHLNSAAGFPLTGNPSSIALDGSGNAWYVVDNSSTLCELVGVAVPVATPLSYGAANNKLGTRP